MREAIATPKKTQEILNKYQLHAQKRFGQNFLIDVNIVQNIAKVACDADCLCLEVGPGIGSLTQQLALYAPEVIAYEIDKKLVPLLQKELASYPQVKIREADFLELDLHQVDFKDKELTFCSNLPYYITTPILFKLLESPLHIRRFTVMMQKEVAERLWAQPNSPEYGALSVIIAYRYQVKKVLAVKRHCFSPAPKVDSVVLQLLPIRAQNYAFEQSFYRFVQCCFKQRRKTLFNNLKTEFASEKILSVFCQLNLKENVRAQELDLLQFLALHEAFYEG